MYLRIALQQIYIAMPSKKSAIAIQAKEEQYRLLTDDFEELTKNHLGDALLGKVGLLCMILPDLIRMHPKNRTKYMEMVSKFLQVTETTRYGRVSQPAWIYKHFCEKGLLSRNTHL
jgi:hypothetical protein